MRSGASCAAADPHAARARGSSSKTKGYDCTQATVSRDITDMGLRKQPEGIYVLAEDLHLQRMIAELVTSVAHTNNLALVKTSPGTAQGVAAALDAADLDGNPRQYRRRRHGAGDHRRTRSRPRRSRNTSCASWASSATREHRSYAEREREADGKGQGSTGILRRAGHLGRHQVADRGDTTSTSWRSRSTSARSARTSSS